ncbi:hypothetical protein AYI68_g1474 [Smittium mucronatum]|uniref:Uncharacterized protein n=1 Tax=Smittium mucronatum TaxID=133383 RepID=A0A1R0H5G4_9FUNG|nr:hypothetical protein AYI68_g1474 [Smittium mucronatum]
MVMRNHELIESSAYTYGFAPEVDAWGEVAEDRDSEASVSIYIEALELSGDLEPSVNLSGEPVMEYLVSSLLGLSLGSGPHRQVRFSPIIPTMGAVQTLSDDTTGSNGRIVDRRSKGATPVLKSLLDEGEEYASDILLEVAHL